MSVSITKLASSSLLLALLAGSALAQTGPLALPPADMKTDAQKPVIISAPEPSGLALPPAEPVVSSAPASTPTTQPVATAPATATAQPAAAPATIEATTLKDVKPDSIGLIASNEGGLGAGMWKGTSRAYVERFMPMLVMPLPYAALNNLAMRFLLTTAGAPEGASSAAKGQSLTAMRVDKLVALGNAVDAWKLASLASTDTIDEITLRQAAEAALVSPAAADVCAKLPAIMKQRSAIDWQKLLVVCQIQAKDMKAAQLSLDLMHTQDMHDDTFFALIEKNLIGGSKQLPRQLTPLKPLNLALMQILDLPIRTEVYIKPDAVLVPELLQAKAADDKVRIALAERAAAKGIISAKDLATIYRSQIFPAEILAAASSSSEQGPILRALLFQAIQQEKTTKTRITEATKFIDSLEPSLMGGGVLTALGSVIGDLQPISEYFDASANMARVYVLTGQANNALAWLELARGGARGMPQVASDLHKLWPMVVFAGLESDKDFDKNLDAWLDFTLRPTDQQDGEARDQKAQAAALMLLMDAIGFTVEQDAWARVADSAVYEKTLVPPAFILERLHAAAAGNRKGEAVLLGMLASMGGKDDPPLLATIETIRSLRTVGLTNDAGMLAKEVGLRILNAPAKH